MRAVLFLAAALLAGPACAAPGWHDAARPGDAARLRRLEDAWAIGLTQARAGFPKGTAALGAAVDPKAALSQPQPPAGLYRCRTLGLGVDGPGGDALEVQDWMHCRIEPGPGGLEFEKLGSAPRPAGRLLADDPRRMVFLDAQGRVGTFARIGVGHWRLALPRPKPGSGVDIVELRR